MEIFVDSKRLHIVKSAIYYLLCFSDKTLQDFCQHTKTEYQFFIENKSEDYIMTEVEIQRKEQYKQPNNLNVYSCSNKKNRYSNRKHRNSTYTDILNMQQHEQ